MTFDVIQPVSEDNAVILCKAPGSDESWDPESMSWTFVDPTSGERMVVSVS